MSLIMLRMLAMFQSSSIFNACAWTAYGRGRKPFWRLPTFLQRELHVFKYVTSAVASPTVYTPASGCCLGSPLRIAFLEPGHFHAVFDDTNSNKSDHYMTVKNSVSANIHHLN